MTLWRSRLSQVRQTKLLEIIQSRGYASIEQLAGELGCSQPTIRRDIKKLCAENRLQRFHGGVSRISSVVRLGYQSKSSLMSEEKKAIAMCLCPILENYDSIFLDTGSTCDRVAAAIADNPPLTIITHNISAALILARQESGHTIVITGGTIRGADGSIIGAKTIKEISAYHTDCAVICASGLDTQGNILDFDIEKVEIKKAMMNAATSKILLLDSSKFAKRGAVRIGQLTDFDLCITDKQPTSIYQDMFTSGSISLVVADRLPLPEVSLLPEDD
jgi:DeoR family glycerol-3-phosphate regulon repressor